MTRGNQPQIHLNKHYKKLQNKMKDSNESINTKHDDSM